jgi:hypothetical protein
MSLTVLLDAGPLGLVTNPKRTPDTIAAAQWVFDMEAAGHRSAESLHEHVRQFDCVRLGSNQRRSSFLREAPNPSPGRTDPLPLSIGISSLSLFTLHY